MGKTEEIVFNVDMKRALQKPLDSSKVWRPSLKNIFSATALSFSVAFIGLDFYRYFHGVELLSSCLPVPQQQQQEKTRPPYKDYVNKTYDPECRWLYDESLGGYPPVANDGKRDVATYICPSTFRDLSDYVYSWPYSRFGEEQVWVADHNLAVRNLPPMPIIYSRIDHVAQGDLLRFIKQYIRQPYILITGENDEGVPSCRHAHELLEDPNLVMWFAQNNDESHPKVTALPIGLNCFEHAPEMHEALEQLNEKGWPAKKDLLYVNFAYTHDYRRKVWPSLCESNKTFPTCDFKNVQNNIRGNPHLVDYYKTFSTNKYVASPRGNGIDCHRFWEAQYLGVIPVVEHSPLDALYEKTGNVLFIEQFADLTEDVLLEQYPRFEKALKERGHRVHEILTKDYWRNVIEQTRKEAIHKFGLQDVIPRKRCWGLTP